MTSASIAAGMFVAATLLLAVGMGLLLPRGRSGGRMAGAILAAAGVGALASQLPGLSDWLSTGLYTVVAGATIAAAVTTVSLRDPVHSAIWFGIMLLGTAGLFLFQGAPLLAVATVTVYAGAILAAFLFVPMLADSKGRATCDRVSWEAFVSAATGAVIVGILSMTVANVLTGQEYALLHHCLIVGALLFGIGTIGFLSRRNMILMFLSAEMMLQGVSLSLVGWSRFHNDHGGRMLVLFIMAVAVCEAALAMALIPMLFRRRGSLDIALWQELRESNQPPFVDREEIR